MRFLGTTVPAMDFDQRDAGRSALIWRAVVAFVFAFVVVLLATPHARAHNAGESCDSGAGVCAGDDDVHRWCTAASYDGKQAMINAAEWAMDKIEEDTMITTTKVDECTSATDVRFRDFDLTGAFGMYQCTDWAGSDHPKKCRASIVSLDRDVIVAAATHAHVLYSNGIMEDDQLRIMLRKTSCHESMHSLGLTHHAGVGQPSRPNWYDGSGGDHAKDCLVSGWIEDPDNWHRVNDYHADRIAAFYS